MNPYGSKMRTSLRVSAIIPALNEAQTIESVVRELIALQRSHGAPLLFEVIVANNGSTDATSALASKSGAKVIDVAQRGYGQACWMACEQAVGDVLLFVDGDGAVDVNDIPSLLMEISSGADMVIGNRCHYDPGSMTSTQVFGNWFACYLMNAIWGMNAKDLGPLRAIRRDAYVALGMQDRSYGWTVEMQVRAHVLGMRTAQREVSWRARAGGSSKVSGTLRGAVGAGFGILGMIFRIWLGERRRLAVLPTIKIRQP
jgi:glycosyltransferase involved in cell wall biosynthesis